LYLELNFYLVILTHREYKAGRLKKYRKKGQIQELLAETWQLFKKFRRGA
jgi:hypothetical protein